MSDTIDTLVRRLDWALSRIDAMSADALAARTEHHRLTTLLSAAQKRAEEAEAERADAEASRQVLRDAATSLCVACGIPLDTPCGEPSDVRNARIIGEIADRYKAMQAERDRLRAALDAMRAAPVDARIVKCIEAFRLLYPAPLYKVENLSCHAHSMWRAALESLRALDGVDLTAQQPDDLARKACEACEMFHRRWNHDTPDEKPMSQMCGDVWEVGSALAARRAKGVES